MLSFRQYLEESRTLEIGRNPTHTKKFRNDTKLIQQAHDVIKKSYSDPKLNGYLGLGSGTKEESDAIHSDLSNPNHHIQATIDRGEITSVIIKRKERSEEVKGRKLIALGTDNTEKGKKDIKRLLRQGIKRQNFNAELSGGAEKLIIGKMKAPIIPAKEVGKIIKKDVTPVDDTTYERSIGGAPREKKFAAWRRKKTLDKTS